MAQLEKSTVTIPTAAAVFVSIIGVFGGVIGNYYATRSAVSLELNQIKNDLRYEVAELRNADEILRIRINQNTEAINTMRVGLRPEEPSIKGKRR
jgi:hypothetical protein